MPKRFSRTVYLGCTRWALIDRSHDRFDLWLFHGQIEDGEVRANICDKRRRRGLKAVERKPFLPPLTFHARGVRRVEVCDGLLKLYNQCTLSSIFGAHLVDVAIVDNAPVVDNHDA